MILTQPQSNQFAFVGGTVSFSVSATNFTGYITNRSSNGAKTNVYYTGRTAGTVTNKYDFYGVGDRITMYYGGSQIYDTGQVSGKGNFNVSYGPGTDQSVTVIVNEGNNYTPSDWEYKLSMLAPLYYQWYCGPAGLIFGATNTTYTITDAQTNQTGTYSVLVSDTGSPVGSEPATLTVSAVAVYANGQRIDSTQYSFAGSVNVQIQSGYANGSIYYTLTTNTLPIVPTEEDSPRYTGPFVLTTNATLRALAVNAAGTQSGQVGPIAFTNIASIPGSAFTLIAVTAGGGNITLNPTNGIYVSNTVVNITATTDAGWTFLGWLGDANGTSLTNSVKMDRNRYVEAVFGTSLGVTTTNGTVSLSPVSTLYPFGTEVRVTATPLAGWYLNRWGDAASGTTNPLYFQVSMSNQTISASFRAVNTNQAALTVAITGSGQVDVSPRSNLYVLDTNVTLTATPNSGQSFLGWNGNTNDTTKYVELRHHLEHAHHRHFHQTIRPCRHRAARGHDCKWPPADPCGRTRRAVSTGSFDESDELGSAHVADQLDGANAIHRPRRYKHRPPGSTGPSNCRSQQRPRSCLGESQRKHQATLTRNHSVGNWVPTATSA